MRNQYLLINEFTVLRESKIERNFFINKNYNGCPNDSGWLVVKDGNLTNPCDWEKQTSYPQFLYGQHGQVTKWNDMGMIPLFKTLLEICNICTEILNI